MSGLGGDPLVQADLSEEFPDSDLDVEGFLDLLFSEEELESLDDSFDWPDDAFEEDSLEEDSLLSLFPDDFLDLLSVE